MSAYIVHSNYLAVTKIVLVMHSILLHTNVVLLASPRKAVPTYQEAATLMSGADPLLELKFMLAIHQHE